MTISENVEMMAEIAEDEMKGEVVLNSSNDELEKKNEDPEQKGDTGQNNMIGGPLKDENCDFRIAKDESGAFLSCSVVEEQVFRTFRLHLFHAFAQYLFKTC